MSSMTGEHGVVAGDVVLGGVVVGGVDTHSEVHHAAVLDALGRELADRQFPATSAGYQALLTWLLSQGSA